MFRVVFLVFFAIVFEDMPVFVALVLPIKQHTITKKKIKSTDLVLLSQGYETCFSLALFAKVSVMQLIYNLCMSCVYIMY